MAIQVTTDKESYELGEIVRVRVKNVGDKPVEFPNVAFGLEISRRGKRVYSPIVILAKPLILPPPLQPGEEKEVTWNQKNDQRVQVGPDVYTATVSPSKEKPVSKPFVIGEPPAGVFEDILDEIKSVRASLEKKRKR